MAGIKAVLLAGGLGTRLRPLTNTLPKALVPVANRPLVSYSLEMLRRGGVEEATLACGYLADRLRDAFAADGHELQVSVVEETEPLDTAGAVRHALDHADAPFIVMNGDQIVDADVAALLAAHREREADLTIVVRRVSDVSPFGLVPCREDGGVEEFGEKRPVDPSGRNLVNAGMYVFSPCVLEAIPAGQPYSNERQLFPGLIGEGRRVFAFRLPDEAYWADVGTPDSYLEANAALLAGALPWAVRAGTAPEAQVAPDCRLAPPVSLAAGCVLAAGTEVGPHVSVGEGASIKAGSAVRNAVLWPGAEVGPDCRVSNVIIGPRRQVSAGTVLEPEEATIL